VARVSSRSTTGRCTRITDRRLLRDVRANANRERLKAQRLQLQAIEARALARLGVAASRRLRTQTREARADAESARDHGDAPPPA